MRIIPISDVIPQMTEMTQSGVKPSVTYRLSKITWHSGFGPKNQNDGGGSIRPISGTLLRITCDDAYLSIARFH